jgi:hypothetical protein
MTTRNIYVIGQGYNPTPVSAVVTVDGTVVHTGPVPTVDQPIAVSYGPTNTELQQQMLANKTAIFGLEKDVLYTGASTVTIQAVDGPIWFGSVVSNYVIDTRINPALTPEQQAIFTNPASTKEQLQQIQFDIANPPFTSEEIALIQASPIPYSAEMRPLIYSHNAELRLNSSGPDGYAPLPDFSESLDDTWSSVTINSVPQSIDPNMFNPPLTGTWWWVLYPGDVFQGTLRIAQGVPTP